MNLFLGHLSSQGDGTARAWGFVVPSACFVRFRLLGLHFRALVENPK